MVVLALVPAPGAEALDLAGLSWRHVVRTASHLADVGGCHRPEDLERAFQAAEFGDDLDPGW